MVEKANLVVKYGNWSMIPGNGHGSEDDFNAPVLDTQVRMIATNPGLSHMQDQEIIHVPASSFEPNSDLHHGFLLGRTQKGIASSGLMAQMDSASHRLWEIAGSAFSNLFGEPHDRDAWPLPESPPVA